jgi:hypothetical protein
MTSAGNRRRSVLILLVVIWASCSSIDVQAKENPTSGEPTRNGIDIVFLVDTSKSMDDFFEDVRGSLIEYVQKALVGDRIIIITFGDKSYLNVKRPIRNQYDKQTIIKKIEQIHPTDYSTYIVLALQQGLAELAELDEKGSRNIKFLILITDGKNNPPKDITTPLTFDTILKGYENFEPGRDWFMHYITLRNVNDTETLAFSRQVGSSILNIENTSLAECINSTQVPVLMRITETLNLVEVLENGRDSWQRAEGVDSNNPWPLRKGDCAQTGADGVALIQLVDYGYLGVYPATEFEVNRARRNPVTETVDIAIQVKRGATLNFIDDGAKVEFLMPQGTSLQAGSKNASDD